MCHFSKGPVSINLVDVGNVISDKFACGKKVLNILLVTKSKVW